METPTDSRDSTDGRDPSVSSTGSEDYGESNHREQQPKPNADVEIKKKSDALAMVLSTMLTSVIRDFDSKAQLTLQSQNHLTSAIDRFTQAKTTPGSS